MLKNKTKMDYSKPANTFIDKGVTIEANKLSGAESVRIDGSYIGDIDLDGYLQVGESGIIEGNMHVAYALVAGKIIGNIISKGTIQLASSAKMQGNISANSVIIDEGAMFYGYCKTLIEKNEVEVVVI